MNITQERYSLLELWLESFRVINRCVGKLLGLVLLAVIVAAVMSGSFTWIMHKLQTGYSASTVLPFVGMAIALSLFYNLSWLFGWVLLTRVISDQATQEHLPFYELASSSIIPTLKLLVAGILFAIPLSLVGGLISFLPGGKILSFLFLFAIGITLGVRLIYTFMAIALKEQGPVSGFSYSWKLTKGAYIDTLLMCIVNVLTVMLVQALLFLLLYAMYTLIPLKFADSFSLAHLSPIWWSAAGVFGIIDGRTQRGWRDDLCSVARPGFDRSTHYFPRTCPNGTIYRSALRPTFGRVASFSIFCQHVGYRG